MIPPFRFFMIVHFYCTTFLVLFLYEVLRNRFGCRVEVHFEFIGKKFFGTEAGALFAAAVAAADSTQ